MSITQTFTTPTTAPARTQSKTTFNTNVENRLAWEATHVTELSAFVTQANALAASMNSVASGGLAIPYKFSTTITDADPGAGYLRLDNATQNAATTIRLDLVDSAGSTQTDRIATWDDSTSTVKGDVMIVKAGDGTKWLAGNLASIATPSGYRNLTITITASSAANPFTAEDDLLIAFTPKGDKGDTGSQFSTAAAGGTVDAITATFSPAISLSDQQMCAVVCAGANTSTTPTFAPDGLTAHTITMNGGQALAAGSIPAAGFVALLEYNLANTRWELLNPYDGAGNHCVSLHTGNGYGSTNTKVRRYTTAQTNAGTAITYADSAANGASLTINETALYLIQMTDLDNSASTVFNYGASLNSATLTTNVESLTAAEILMINKLKTAASGGEFGVTVSTIAYLAAGDVVRPHADGNADSVDMATSRFTIRKVGNV